MTLQVKYLNNVVHYYQKYTNQYKPIQKPSTID